MMNIEYLVMYSVVSFFYVISPGPAVFLAISNGMTADTRAVAASSFGNIVGLFLLSSISILGLGAIIIASATIFLIIKLLGATYLIYLGIKQFRTQKISFTDQKVQVESSRPLFSYFREGFLLAVTNPKAIVFFTALFPQFLSLESAIMPQFLIMTALFMAMSFSVLFSYGTISKSAKGLLNNQHRMVWFHRITGSLFISMGIGLLQLRNSQS